jgi:hypothetical protein
MHCLQENWEQSMIEFTGRQTVPSKEAVQAEETSIGRLSTASAATSMMGVSPTVFSMLTPERTAIAVRFQFRYVCLS